MNSETRKLNLPSDKISIHFTCSRVDLELGEILANEHGIGSNDRKKLIHTNIQYNYEIVSLTQNQNQPGWQNRKRPAFLNEDHGQTNPILLSAL